MKTHAEQRPRGTPGLARRLGGRAAGLMLLLVLQACGGSGGVDSGGTGITPATLAVGPISGFGSIVVAGVHYDDTSASIVDGDGQAVGSSVLTLGSMTSIDASAVSAVGTRLEAKAQTIRVAEVVLGLVELIDAPAQTVRVLGQTVAVTSGTVFEATLGGGLRALRVGMLLAVHGQLDSASARVVATRIEPRSAASQYVVRGPVASLDRAAKRLAIGALVVSLDELGSLPAALATGTVLRLKLRTAAVAGLWTATELRLDGLAVPDRDNIEVEGRVTAFTSAQRFSVDGATVDASAATFTGGTVAPGVRVEVEGRSSAGTIVARRVSVDSLEGGGDDAIEVEGRITALDTAAKTFVVRGVTISYASGATFVVGSAADLALNRMVNVKGKLAADRSHVDARLIHIEL